MNYPTALQGVLRDEKHSREHLERIAEKLKKLTEKEFDGLVFCLLKIGSD